MADVAIEPSFPRREFDMIRRREMAALVHEIDEPGAVADRAMLCTAYGSHPYGHPIEGMARHLGALRRADAVQFHKRFFGPAEATLVAVAAQDSAEVIALCRKRLGRWRSPTAATLDLPVPPPCDRRVVCVDKPEVNQSQLRIALPAIARSSPEYFPAVVAASVFGGGFTSRLMEAVRVNRGLSYSIRSRFAMGRAGGLFVISTFTKNETAAELLDVIFDEVSRFCDDGPTLEELERTQSYLSGLYPLSFETHDQIAAKLSDMALYGTPLEDVTQYGERIHAVTSAQCRDLARRHFPQGRGVVVAVGPAQSLAPKLEKLGPVTIVPARRFV
jgi:zinc protease